MAQLFPRSLSLSKTAARWLRSQRYQNKANRGNRKVTYHAYRAFRALFFGNALWQRDKKFGLASPLGHT